MHSMYMFMHMACACTRPDAIGRKRFDKALDTAVHRALSRPLALPRALPRTVCPLLVSSTRGASSRGLTDLRTQVGGGASRGLADGLTDSLTHSGGGASRRDR